MLKNRPRQRHIEDVEELLGYVKVLHTTPESSHMFGKKRAELEKEGELIDDMDLLIASIIVAEGLEIVTRNVSHFNRIEELEVYTPKELGK